ncbi:hypothetical protein [Candidatus Viadribacter manganicus]|uniref:hypothetical protein n=1 Tax=Candidatus Viadribacter manganicus TaxID=1759059 RepID=UPI0012EAE3C9|nr:hypothetical protein [Candidatus Viadribacter manganicus]
MSASANHVLTLAEQLRETFAAQTVDRNAVNLLVHDALLKALDIKPVDMRAESTKKVT